MEHEEPTIVLREKVRRARPRWQLRSCRLALPFLTVSCASCAVLWLTVIRMVMMRLTLPPPQPPDALPPIDLDSASVTASENVESAHRVGKVMRDAKLNAHVHYCGALIVYDCAVTCAVCGARRF
jgi:hypothetical protein